MRLHADHVDEETQRAQVVSQAVKGSGLDGLVRIDFGLRQGVHIVAHVKCGGRGLVQAQHGQDTPHRRQLCGHRDQHLALGRVAEVLVDLLFDLGQGCAQFLHHAAHGLPVGNTPVELLHPAVQRLRIGTAAHIVDALGQAAHAQGQLGLIEFAVFQRSVQVQDARGHFHRQARRRGLPAGYRLRHGRQQGLRQHIAIGQQLLQRITHQRKLLGQAGHAVHLTAGHGRPRILGHRHAFLGQGQQGRVEATQSRRLVVRRRLTFSQAPDLAHRRQARRLVLGGGHGRMAAEKEQVLRETIGQVALAAHGHAQLGQQARRQALGVDIADQQPTGLRFQHGRGELPERGELAALRQLAGASGQIGTQVTHARQRALRCSGAAVAHQREHQRFHRAARFVIGSPRLGRSIRRQLAPLPIDVPQVGRVHAVCTRELLRGPVLREQGHRRHGLAGQLPREEIQQAEGHLFHSLDRSGVHGGGLGHHALHGHFGSAQHRGGSGQAYQFERANTLVDLVARAAQHRGVHHVDIRVTQGFSFLQVAAQRFVGVFKRTAQLAVDPGQGAQVFARRFVVALALGFHRVLHR